MAGSIPTHIKSIAIPLVNNQTAEFGIAENITDNIIEVFNEENILRIVDVDDSDSILRGTIISLDDAPYTFSSEEAVSEYRINITMEITWFDVENDVELLKKRYSGWVHMVYQVIQTPMVSITMVMVKSMMKMMMNSENRAHLPQKLL